MKLAYKNLAVSAAFQVLSKHVAEHLECMGENDSLLTTAINNFLPGRSFPDRHGAYLFLDKLRAAFIRPGKKTRGG